MHTEGSCSKAAVLSKVQMLNLVLGVGVFSLLPIRTCRDAGKLFEHFPGIVPLFSLGTPEKFGNSAKSLRKFAKIRLSASGKGAEILLKISDKFLQRPLPGAHK